MIAVLTPLAWMLTRALPFVVFAACTGMVCVAVANRWRPLDRALDGAGVSHVVCADLDVEEVASC